MERSDKQHGKEIKKIEDKQNRRIDHEINNKNKLIPHSNPKATHFHDFKHFVKNVFNANKEIKDDKNHKNDTINISSIPPIDNKNSTKLLANTTISMKQNNTEPHPASVSSFIPSLSSFF